MPSKWPFGFWEYVSLVVFSAGGVLVFVGLFRVAEVLFIGR